MPIIETHNLSKKFGQRLAVDDLTMEVAEGEVLGFLGPNGAGKTTTIRMLSGIIAPTSGSAIVAGLRPDREPEKLHEVIGLLTESAGFYDRLTARRNLEYFAGFYSGIEVSIQVEKYLRLTGLWDRQRDKVGAFSKGMKQRLALARALLHEPKVLFLDEPTAGLDPEAAQEVRQMIKKLSMEGRTVFLSTHNLAEAEYLCHRIAVIRTRILALDTPDSLRQRLFRRRVIVQLESVSPSMVEAVRSLAFVGGITQEGDRLLIDLVDTDKNRPELVKCIVDAGGRVLGVSEEQHSLEEVYLSLVKEDR
jgi:ABC-2 type transport system ATP-binding protein